MVLLFLILCLAGKDEDVFSSLIGQYPRRIRTKPPFLSVYNLVMIDKEIALPLPDQSVADCEHNLAIFQKKLAYYLQLAAEYPHLANMQNHGPDTERTGDEGKIWQQIHLIGATRDRIETYEKALAKKSSARR